jgi:hypothetical protein
MSQRIDDAWADPRALWALILDDEPRGTEPGDAAELGEIAERLYLEAAEARTTATRLRAEVHSLTGQLHYKQP